MRVLSIVGLFSVLMACETTPVAQSTTDQAEPIATPQVMETAPPAVVASSGTTIDQKIAILRRNPVGNNGSGKTLPLARLQDMCRQINPGQTRLEDVVQILDMPHSWKMERSTWSRLTWNSDQTFSARNISGWMNVNISKDGIVGSAQYFEGFNNELWRTSVKVPEADRCLPSSVN